VWPKGPELLVLLALAVVIALVLALTKPIVGLAVMLGVLVLAAAFLSTPASLYLLVFSMLLGPEFVAGGLAGGATIGRGVTLRLDDLLLVVIGFVWLAKVAIHKEQAPFLRTPLNRAIMLYIAAAVLATLIGMLMGRVKPMTGFFFLLKYYEYAFLYFMVINAVTDQKQARGLIIASLVVCFLVSLYAIAQIPSGDRASAPFEGKEGEPNTLGGYLVFMLAIVTGLLLTPKAVPNRLPLWVLMGVGGVGLLATLSRVSFLAAVAVVLAIVVFTNYRKPLVLVMILIGLLSAPWWAPQAVKDRIMYTFTQPSEEGQVKLGGVKLDTSTSDRIRSWQRGLELWKQSPVWGTGVTGGPFLDAMYPRVLIETGSLGMVAFVYLLWAIFRVGRTAYQHAQDPFTKGVALGFLLGFVGLVIHAIGANTFLIVRIMEPFWLFAALVVGNLMRAQSNQPAEIKVESPTALKGVPRASGMKVAGKPTVSRPGVVRLRRP
jgi:hypothetical protein